MTYEPYNRKGKPPFWKSLKFWFAIFGGWLVYAGFYLLSPPMPLVYGIGFALLILISIVASSSSSSLATVIRSSNITKELKQFLSQVISGRHLLESGFKITGFVL